MSPTPPSGHHTTRYWVFFFVWFFCASCFGRRGDFFIENNHTGSERLVFGSKTKLEIGTVQSAPVLCRHTYLIAGDNGYLFAYDLEKKQIRWQKNLQIAWARASVYENTAYLGSRDGHLYGVDVESGRIVLRLKLHGPSEYSATAAEGRLYLTAKDGYLRSRSYVYGISLTEKKELWNYRLEGESKHRPCLSGDLILVSDEQNVYGIRKEDGRLTWQREIARPPRAQLTQHGAHLYVVGDGGHIEAISTTNTASVWRFRADTIVSHAPLSSDGFLVFGDWRGTVYALEEATGTLAWKLKTKEWLYAAPTRRGNNLYFYGYDGTAFSMSSATRATNWRLKLRGITDMIPSFRADTLDLFTIRGNLYKFYIRKNTIRDNKKQL